MKYSDLARLAAVAWESEYASDNYDALVAWVKVATDTPYDDCHTTKLADRVLEAQSPFRLWTTAAALIREWLSEPHLYVGQTHEEVEEAVEDIWFRVLVTEGYMEEMACLAYEAMGTQETLTVNTFDVLLRAAITALGDVRKAKQRFSRLNQEAAL